MKYVTKDGKEFTDQDAAVRHERGLEKQLDEKLYDYVNHALPKAIEERTQTIKELSYDDTTRKMNQDRIRACASERDALARVKNDLTGILNGIM